MPRASIAIALIATTLVLGACAADSASPSTASAEPSTPTVSGEASVEPTNSVGPSAAATPAGSATDLTSVPTACFGLGADDCRRVVAQVATIVPPGSAVTYIQVGPFGCAAGAGCARSLAERPQGDITLEAGVGALSYHVTVSSSSELTIERQDAFGVLLGPESQPPVAAGARPFFLGHCGLWSGIDAGGSWWDPVGAVDGDHPDAINAADGTMTIQDPDHATFTSKGGFTVHLVRHEGDKYLPLCQ
jgi:hypothetical protein